MISDLENSLLILQKWRSSAALIKFVLATPSLRMQVWVRVLSESKEEIVLEVVGENVGTFSIKPEDVKFEYQDSREADEEIKTEAESAAVCALSLLIDGDMAAFLYEMRD